MSNTISGTQAAQAADEIIRLAGLAKNYCAKLNGEVAETDESADINSAMKQDEQLREQGDEGVIKAAFKKIAEIATQSSEGIVPDDQIVRAEPIPPPLPASIVVSVLDALDQPAKTESAETPGEANPGLPG